MKLTNSPFLQIALDIVSFENLEQILSQIPQNMKILLEAGTPLIKKFGISIVDKIREYNPNSYVIADMKTLDVGWLEVIIAADAFANAVAISGLASVETIESSLKEGKQRDIDIILDCMNVDNPKKLLDSLSRIPEIILFHRGIDQENNMDHPWEIIQVIKNNYPESLIAVAGGLNLVTSERALNNGADIIVVGRAITQAEDIGAVTENFLQLL
ncbi:MAG: orotidine 5'-phosphate decarboxylase / HUMPS family protein [Candidatus Heimdallarchaeaceae archaeon]